MKRKRTGRVSKLVDMGQIENGLRRRRKTCRNSDIEGRCAPPGHRRWQS
jgi:hypothetical protein